MAEQSHSNCVPGLHFHAARAQGILLGPPPVSTVTAATSPSKALIGGGR